MNLNDFLQELNLVFKRVGFSIDDIRSMYRSVAFNKQAQMDYLTDFLTWIEDGNNPMQAARGVVAGVDPNEKKPIQWYVSEEIMEVLEDGRPIVDGMRGWFSDEICALFESAKNSDSKVLKMMLSEYLAQQNLLKQVKASLISPIKLPLIYSLFAFIGLYSLATGMLPMFFEIVPLNRWEPITQDVYALMLWFNQYAIILFISIVVFFFLIKYQLASNTSAIRIYLDDYYPLNLYKNIVAMRLMKFIGILVMMNDNPATAIRRVIISATPWEFRHLDMMLHNLEKGEQNIARVMDTGLLPRSVLHRLSSIANVSSDDLKKVAISHAADRSGGEIIKGMKNVTRIATVFSWLLLLSIMITAVLTFVSIMGAMQSLRA
jgi:type II secretory pathway component PulF